MPIAVSYHTKNAAWYDMAQSSTHGKKKKNDGRKNSHRDSPAWLPELRPHATTYQVQYTALCVFRCNVHKKVESSDTKRYRRKTNVHNELPPNWYNASLPSATRKKKNTQTEKKKKEYKNVGQKTNKIHRESRTTDQACSTTLTTESKNDENSRHREYVKPVSHADELDRRFRVCTRACV